MALIPSVIILSLSLSRLLTPFMAAILSFAPLSVPSTTYPKPSLRIPLFTSLPLPSSSSSSSGLTSSFLVRNEASLSPSSSPIQALAEEEAVDDSSPSASSSKLVLVVGGTGGVGTNQSSTPNVLFLKLG